MIFCCFKSDLYLSTIKDINTMTSFNENSIAYRDELRCNPDSQIRKTMLFIQYKKHKQMREHLRK